ncbi:MAG: substrate-binding domain-containing protein, partial [Planctomycetes bacterium]|nr:substrate-binding domain-containing protein [Planctomycetota bacterium]
MALRRKILLLLESARTCERDFLRGIARYSHLHGPWAFYRKPKFYLKNHSSGISLSQIKTFDPDGIIVSDIENLDPILRLDIPTLVHAFKTDAHDSPTIIGDSQETGRMAANHLLGLGFSRFAYCGLGRYYWSTARHTSFRQAIEKAGFDVAYFELHPQQIKNALPKELLRLSKWLSSVIPAGLMACADDCSQHIVEACKIADIQIPEQIGLIGVDNDDMVCELSDPPLSSIALDFAKAGHDAADLLDHLMSSQDTANQRITVHPSHIVTRASTDILAIDDNDVAMAVQFIRQHTNKLIQIADVLNHVTCSQRTLHQKFQTSLGRSVHQEIKQVRIERIARLLRETD